jgi:prevent-host-death family protein
VKRAPRDSEQFKHELRSVAELRAKTRELLRRASKTRRPIILTEDGTPAAVLLDAASYSELRETALLLEVRALGRRAARKSSGAARRRPRLR